MINATNLRAPTTDSAGLQSTYWACRLFVVVQIAICFLLGLGDRGRAIGALVVCLSIVLGERFRLSKSLHTALLVFSGIFFSCFAFSRFIGERSAGLLDLFELLAEYLIIVQSLELLRKRATSLASYQEANYLPGLGTIVIVMLLVSRETTLSPSALPYLFTGFSILLVLVMRPDFVGLMMGAAPHRRKAVALAIILAVGTSAGSLFRGEVSRQIPLLQTALRSVQSPMDETERTTVRSQARLVDRVDLSSVSTAQRTAPDELVFRVEAGQHPGYMRTLSFDKFDGIGWSNSWSAERRTAGTGVRIISPLKSLPVELASIDKPKSSEFFEMPDRQGGNYLDMKVIIPPGHGRQVPLPFTSAYIMAMSEARARTLSLDRHGNVLPNSISNSEYRVLAGENSRWAVDDNYAARLLQIPDAEIDFLKSYAAKVIGAVQSTRDKVQALEEYFAGEFEYSFEPDAIGERRGRSQLRAFLENRKAGHCEYFATASTLLLRSQGIPCRLSTGYLVYEMNDDQEYYYTRNRDAHAWAEAYDEESGNWLLVESTPGMRTYVESFRSEKTDLVEANNGAASNERSLASTLVALFDALLVRWNQVVASRFAWLMPLALGGLLWVIRVQRVRATSNGYSALTSRAVRKADRRALRMGYQRARSETCLQFANRLTETAVPDLVRLAEWYSSYSQKRYTEDATKS